MKRRRLSVAVALLCLAVTGLAEEPTTNAPPLFRDHHRPIPERVADLISRLTVEEKVGQLEMNSPAIERLGIPAYSWWGESVHGVARAGKATIFPQAIALAATWDVNLMNLVATVISDEARAKHAENPNGEFRGLTFFAPCVNLVRDPRWGRAQEAYGEDPYLTTQMALAYIAGMQGDDPRHLKTATIIKHFAVHNQETGRFDTCFEANERDLQEYFFPAFRRSLQDGHARGVMMAFNGLNGAPCTASEWLQRDVLRGEMGLVGPIVTDYGGVTHLTKTFHWTTNDEAGVQAAVTAGVDIICEPRSLYSNMLAAVQSGLVTTQQVDQSLARSLPVRFEVGLFDPPGTDPYAGMPPELTGCPEHLAVAREACRASIVLLKNERIPQRHDATPILPLNRDRLESIAVLGLFADSPYLGNYTGAPAAVPVSLLDGIRHHVSSRVVIRHVPWLDLDERMEQLRRKKFKTPEEEKQETERVQNDHKEQLQAAVDAALESDVTVVMLGLGPKIEDEFRDRLELDLPRDQEEFIKKIVAVNPATIVVLTGGSAIAANWIQERVPGVLMAWLPGEQGGEAMADVLFGDYNPAGRLPMTFPATTAQLPPLNDYDLQKGRTYMYFKGQPLYPFGYGLSYSKFSYANLRVQETGNGSWGVAVQVTNAGARDGDEVVQLYVSDVVASLPVAQKRLQGFQRIHLRAGESQPVSLTVPTTDLGFWDDRRHQWTVEPGEFEVQVGASSADIRLRARFIVK